MNTKDKVLEITFLSSLGHGFDDVSLSQIQKKAAITSGGLYYHFRDKNGILIKMLEKYLFKDSNSFRDKLEFIIYLFVGLYKNNKDKAIDTTKEHDIDYINYHLLFLGIYHQHPEVQYIFDYINKGLLDLFEEMFKEDIANGYVKKENDPQKATILFLTILKGLVSFWINNDSFSLDKIIEDNLEYICKILCDE
ncbi:hypothetical protein ALNOE001_17160 [Candidatus Methanobinarius endosymbioticus]|uniref:HTH tetR-type domain-containing protein n=1 Tax=Candidatus Methanobinarius endosymbioticus TaxID=2006182 RepID=A0A366MAT2_9EURY|nr:hypothetical protein ALNOE001_17160 [Candidatus Methanobinarius endosymbioticus]